MHRILVLVTFILLIATAHASAKTITLAWDPNSETDVTGYRIYYAVNSSATPFSGTGADQGASPVDAGLQTTLTLTGLDDGQTHYFAVTAYTATGEESEYSTIATSPPVLTLPQNTPPVLAAIANQTTVENNPLSFTTPAQDADGDALTFSATNLPQGATYSPTSRTFSWTPGFDQAGSYTITINVSDGAANDSQSVTLTVASTNRAPVLAAVASRTLAEQETLTFNLNASDADGDAMTYSATGLPTGAQLNVTTGAFTWTPGFDQAGSHSIAFTVSDGQASHSQAATFTVAGTNRAPVLAAVASRTLAEQETLSFTLDASDADDDNLTFSATGLPTGAQLDSTTGAFTWTPGFDQAGSHSITFTVSDGQAENAQAVTFSVTDKNRAPSIQGVPTTTIVENSAFQFVPTAADDDGDPLTFTVANKPAWATFSQSTGTLAGTPLSSDIGSYPNIRIDVSDGQITVSLPSFTLQVITNSSDSDGDGVIDSQDAFPADPTESRDFDQDGQGDNADQDDDNDGVVDSQDSAPLDATQSNWIIQAYANAGGYVIPSGDIEVAYGESITLTVAPEKGFLLEDLQVDGLSLGRQTSASFSPVTGHHTVNARFVPIAEGLSELPVQYDIPCVLREDGGDTTTNLVDGDAVADLKHMFQILLRDSSLSSDLGVFLVLNGYAWPMAQITGDAEFGATFETRLPLGPAPEHAYHFEARNSFGEVIWSYPQQGELSGPNIYLLSGKNLLGLPLDFAAMGSDVQSLIGTATLSRYQSDGPSTDINQGNFLSLTSGETPPAGQGLLMKAETGERLSVQAFVQENTAELTPIQLHPGWNLIANPYSGHLRLSALSLRRGTETAVTWETAGDQQWIIDGAYRYLGDNWGGGYQFISSTDTVLVPWVGYWIYLAANDDSYTLIVPRPEL